MQRFYNERRRQLRSPSINPNAAHLALADLEVRWRGDFLLVTQNVDNLHERAGSKNITHMHGELLKMRCRISSNVFEIDTDITPSMACACCNQRGTLRPHIVWFGEMPLEMDLISEKLSRCSLFISIGTSGNVYPAAGFVRNALVAGAHAVEINLEPSLINNAFAEKLYGLASERVPDYVATLLAAQN